MRLAALLLAGVLALQPAAAWAAGEEPTRPAFEGARELTVKATAYTSGPESTGKQPGHPAFGLTATGTRVRQGAYGTIAVDPRVIPLGSLVYIEELGEYRIAEDTGSAIRGHRIDLYMDEVRDAMQWGVRDVHVRVLPKI